MSETEAFREEIRGWIAQHAPQALRGKMHDPDAQIWGGRKCSFPYPESKTWLQLCAERGLTAPSWPEEYGGAGLDSKQARIWQDELRNAQLPDPLVGFGLTMIGPTLLQYGDDAQRQEHLPKIARGEIRWCQGYSEPNAGSDLAGIQTSGVIDGDEIIINGQKVWTSYGDISDWMFLLVRTDPEAPKHSGISFVLMDLDQPGVEVRPIPLISGASPFCESFFNDARASTRNVLGGMNNGWQVAKALLGHERSMIASFFGRSRSKRPTKGHRLGTLAKRYVGEQDGRVSDAVLRDRIADLSMDELAFRMTVKRSQDSAKAGHKPGAETSLFKIYGTELNQRREQLMLALRGPQCLGWEGEGFEEEELEQTRNWLRSLGNTIEGGTSEIQLNIIAKRVLGLPD